MMSPLGEYDASAIIIRTSLSPEKGEAPPRTQAHLPRLPHGASAVRVPATKHPEVLGSGSFPPMPCRTIAARRRHRERPTMRIVPAPDKEFSVRNRTLPFVVPLGITRGSKWRWRAHDDSRCELR